MEKHDLLSEKRTHLAEKRTELAHERTMLAYVRTAATMILFGIAFLGWEEGGVMLFYAGVGAIAVGIFFILIAVARRAKHSKEIKEIKKFFDHLIPFRFRR